MLLLFPLTAYDFDTEGGDAIITITEYGEFQCSFCKKAVPTIKQIKEDYGDKVKVVFKHFPLSFHNMAPKASEAAECARDQGKFWEMHDILFESGSSDGSGLDVTSIKRYASEIGLDTTTFNDCLDSGEKESVVQDNFAEGKAKGVSGTPAFFIQGTTEDGSIIEETINGAEPYEVFKGPIDMMLTGKRLTDNDPAMEIVVVNDKECDSCDPTQILTILNTQLFPKSTNRIVYISSEEGAAMVKDLKLKVIPSYLFPKDVLIASHNYAKLQDMLEDKGEWLSIVPGAAGAGRYLEPPSVDDDPSKGPADAPVTIIEFACFQCPFSARAQDTLKDILRDYGDKVRIVFRDFPLDVLHPDASRAHEAAECADEQGKFWGIHDKIYADQADVSIATMKGYARDLGLDMDSFNACLDGNAMTAEIEADMADGRRFGVSGTPIFFINGISLSGAQPYEIFKKIIDSELDKVGIVVSVPSTPHIATVSPEQHPIPTPSPTIKSDIPCSRGEKWSSSWNVCYIPSSIPTGGSCLSKLDVGFDEQCKSGNCVDGHCCLKGDKWVMGGCRSLGVFYFIGPLLIVLIIIKFYLSLITRQDDRERTEEMKGEILDIIAGVTGGLIGNTIFNVKISMRNETMLNLVDSGLRKVEEGNGLLDKGRFEDARKAYEEGSLSYARAAAIAAKKGSIEDYKKIGEALRSIESSISTTFFRSGDLVGANRRGREVDLRLTYVRGADAMLTAARADLLSNKWDEAEKRFSEVVEYIGGLNEAEGLDAWETAGRLEEGHRGLLRAKLQKGLNRIEVAQSLFNDGKFNDSKETYKSARSYLDGVRDEAIQHKLQDMVSYLDGLINVCTQNINLATDSLMGVGGMDATVIRVEDMERGMRQVQLRARSGSSVERNRKERVKTPKNTLPGNKKSEAMTELESSIKKLQNELSKMDGQSEEHTPLPQQIKKLQDELSKMD